MLVLTGLGGVGKTTAALEHIHRHLDDYAVVWQFHAEDSTTMLSQFHDLARILGTDAGGDPVAAVHTVLAAHPGRWLLFLDNIPDHAAARRWIPPKGRGHVVVTTRDGHWPAGQVLLVEPLDIARGADLLTEATGSSDSASARTLAGELGGLPLALAQAAAYCRATGRTPAEYLQLLDRDNAAVLAGIALADHAAPVAATWSLAITRLQADNPAAVTLLRIVAHLAPDDIPFRLLLHPHIQLPRRGLSRRIAREVRALCRDSLALDGAVAALRRHSLIGPAGRTFSIHRLVQTVTRHQMPSRDDQNWHDIAAALVEAAIPTTTYAPETWSLCQLLLPHAQLVADPLGEPMWRLAKFLGDSGDYATASAQWSALAEVYTNRVGPEHPDTLTARVHLARWTGRAGDAVAARDLLATLLPIRARVLGPEHPHTLTTRDNLAAWTGETGDPVAARRQYEALLPVREKVLGSEHPQTLTTRDNLAYWVGEAGDAAAARDLLATLLPIREKVSGPEHPHTLTTRDNLARWTGQAGDAVAARDQYAALLPIRKKISGPEHPHTLTIRDNLASWTGQAGDAVAARDQYAALLPIREKISGPEHPHTLTAKDSLARWTGEAGNSLMARNQYTALLQIREKVSGPEHPHTLITRANAAYWTGMAGDTAVARDLYTALLPIREKVSGAKHPDTLTIQDNLARWTGEAGDPAAARDQYAALLPIREKVSGPEHPDTLTARASFATWTGRAGDASAARDLLATLLPIREKVSGPGHPHSLAVRASLAYWIKRAKTPG